MIERLVLAAAVLYLGASAFVLQGQLHEAEAEPSDVVLAEYREDHVTFCISGDAATWDESLWMIHTEIYEEDTRFFNPAAPTQTLEGSGVRVAIAEGWRITVCPEHAPPALPEPDDLQPPVFEPPTSEGSA